MREKLLLQPEERFILLAADFQPEQTVLDQMDALLPQIQDWTYFSQTAIDRAAAPLIVSKLDRLPQASRIPKDVLRNLQQASLRTLSRNMVLTEHFRQVVAAFDRVGVPVIALKGVMLSDWLYGNINLRQFSDLDLLVPMEKASFALQALRDMGYAASSLNVSEFIRENTSIVHYEPMIKNGVSVEVHVRLHAESEHYRVDLPGIWERAMSMTLHGVPALTLRPEDLLLHLCFHLDKHFRSGEFQFTSMYDIVNMLNHKAEAVDWPLFEQTCKQAGAQKETYPYLLLAGKYLEARLPEGFSQRYASLLSPRMERQFLGMLRGKGVPLYTAAVMRNLEHLNNWTKGFRYLFDLFFPSTEFMMRRYHLRHKRQLWWYYPLRQLSGVKTIWLTLKKAFS